MKSTRKMARQRIHTQERQVIRQHGTRPVSRQQRTRHDVRELQVSPKLGQVCGNSFVMR